MKNLRQRRLELGWLGKTKRVIYRHDGDRLTLCWPEGDDYPADFSPGPETVLIVLERSDAR